MRIFSERKMVLHLTSSKEDVEEDLEEYGEELYPTLEFKEMVRQGLFNQYDGIGFYHDGHKQRDEPVDLSNIIECFPYVIWHSA